MELNFFSKGKSKLANSDLVKKISRESMHGFGFQIDLKSQNCMLTKFNGNSFLVKLQSAVLNICHLTTFFSNHNVITDLLRRETTYTYFSVKSSREVHWIIMFQKDAVCLMVHPHHILTTLPLSTTPPACTLLSSLCQSLLPARPWHNLFPPIKPEWTCRFCTCALALTMAYIVRNHLPYFLI